MAQDMNCNNPNDPSTCTLFSGKYYSCYMYDPDPGQPGSYHNGGADCMVNNDFFNQANVLTGYAASDRQLYSQATSNSNNIMGSSTNYSMALNDTNAINNSARLQQNSNSKLVNQDQNINYNGSSSSNPNIGLANGHVVSVTINQDALQKIKGFTSFEAYLSDQSVNLAWNRQKSEPDPGPCSRQLHHRYIQAVGIILFRIGKFFVTIFILSAKTAVHVNAPSKPSEPVKIIV